MRIALHIQIELCSLRLLSKTESKIIASEFGRKVYGPIVRDIVCAQEAPKIVREENEQEALIYLAFYTTTPAALEVNPAGSQGYCAGGR
ncbi:MAG: hypothetical protein O2890_04420 [Cyanobacteria bacterium]|nr:hypothetical protein [Cyanobacteriota bacterium]